MKAFLAVTTLAALVISSGCGKQEQAKKADDDSALSGNPAMAPLDYLAAQGKAKKHAEKTLTTAELTSAIQKFAAIEDRYPRDLNELVQQRYLQAAPTAPAGKMWAYNPQTGLVKLVTAVTNAPAPTAPTAPSTTQPRRGLPGLRNLPQQPTSVQE